MVRESSPSASITALKSPAIILIICIAALLCGAPGLGAAESRVVLVIADYLTLSDLLDKRYPAISRLVAQGGVGLISSGAPGARSVPSSYAAASAGASCRGSRYVDQACSSAESVEDEPDRASMVFRRRTGQAPNASVVHLDLGPLIRDNEEHDSSSLPGALGDALAAAGRKVAVFGNSDLSGKRLRRAAIIGATSAGSIPAGDVGPDMLRPARFSPTGFMTDSARLASSVDAALRTAALVVVDFGDTARVELNKQQMSRPAYELHRQSALRNLDRFLGRMLAGRARSATVILGSIAPRITESGEPKHLAPMVVRRPGGAGGAATSPTTRTPGLIAGFDITPTILSELGVRKPAGMIGSAGSVVRNEAGQAVRLDSLVALNSLVLWPVLGILGGLGILAATSACLVIVLRKKGIVASAVRILMVFSIASPLAMIIATPGSAGPAAYLVRLLVWMLALTALAYGISMLVRRLWAERIGRLPGALPIVVLSVITCSALFVDAIYGGRLVRFTVINAANFEGFRFYGVGNEYMGVWLATSLISMLWLRECWPGWERRRARRLLTLVSCAAVVVALGFPRFGANAGGAVSAVIGFGLVYTSGIRSRFGARHVVFFTVAGFAAVAAISVADLALSRGAPSHIGLAASMSDQQGYSYLLDMAARKFAMNFGLIGTGQARTALIGCVPFVLLWFAGVGGRVDELVADRPKLRWGMISVLVCAAAAFTFNDSGVVAAGIMAGYLVVAAVYSALGTHHSSLRTM